VTWIIAIAVGLAAGLHTSTWGMYKDAPHEGFTWRRYFRSTALAGFIAPAAVLVTGMTLTAPGSLVVLFGLTYVTERAFTEFYKTFLREEDQSKYFIPMQFAVRGRVIDGRRQRWAVGGGVLAVALLLLAAVRALEADMARPHPLGAIVLVGSLGGWFSAFGGAWKDAPIEGFETLKFFRSPAFAAAWALPLSRFTDSLLLMGLAALGFTIATLETYKTFFFPSKPRGKFAGKPVSHPEWLRLRLRFVPLYATIWAAVLAGVGAGLR
jgi:hypothetical protein